ncbi:MAG: aminotransferase class V-fold PLP-dependent enzyme, partial [Mucinivorans sp.]
MDVAMIIDKLGVAIRSGTHCAEPLMQFYGVESMCRASFAMYNTIKECDQAVEAIVRATKMLRG